MVVHKLSSITVSHKDYLLLAVIVVCNAPLSSLTGFIILFMFYESFQSSFLCGLCVFFLKTFLGLRLQLLWQTTEVQSLAFYPFFLSSSPISHHLNLHLENMLIFFLPFFFFHVWTLAHEKVGGRKRLGYVALQSLGLFFTLLVF